MYYHKSTVASFIISMSGSPTGRVVPLAPYTTVQYNTKSVRIESAAHASLDRYHPR